MAETRVRVLNWFVSGGTARTREGAEFAIDVDPLVIGRDPGASIVIEDPEVSALHCELRATGGGILVKDLGSTNGTFLGSVRVHEAVVAVPSELTVGRSKVVIEPQARRRVEVGYTDHFGPLVGGSPRMRRIFGVLERVAPTALNVLVIGETGTGKEAVARAIHEASERRGGPFVVLDCGSLPPALAASILFGHEKGCVPGATEARAGALTEASGGTLFLDELGDLPLEVQPALLRAVSDRRVQRVGATTTEPIDVRILSATRRDLGAEMNDGRFRSDLFFRLAQARVELPPLRERLSDLPLLVLHACERAEKADHAPTVLAWIERRMATHDWPGNVRELVNIASVGASVSDDPAALEDVMTLARGEALLEGPGRPGGTAFNAAKRTAIGAFERDYFMGLARRCKGNVSEMARQSGMERHHVRAYLRKHGIGKGSL
jgi:DNA-binding NtrC family response regulator